MINSLIKELVINLVSWRWTYSWIQIKRSGKLVFFSSSSFSHLHHFMNGRKEGREQGIDANSNKSCLELETSFSPTQTLDSSLSLSLSFLKLERRVAKEERRIRERERSRQEKEGLRWVRFIPSGNNRYKRFGIKFWGKKFLSSLLPQFFSFIFLIISLSLPLSFFLSCFQIYCSREREKKDVDFSGKN